MTAREKFKKGDRVRISEVGRTANIRQGKSRYGGALPSQTGRVVGFGRESHIVQVVMDGTKWRQVVSARFLEKTDGNGL